jgi:hypothetical protein
MADKVLPSNISSALQIHTMVTEVFWLKRFLRKRKMALLLVKYPA